MAEALPCLNELAKGRRMALDDEITLWRKEIKTDGYSMSVGELINLYHDNDLKIRPEFQRLFRWTLEQQSRFIESILLGIPLPSIFVAADQSGVWELVDGLQRISTIFKFVGVLKNAEGAVEAPTALTGTKYLPSLNGKLWENPEDDADPKTFTASQRRDIKRAKVQVQILDKVSDAFGKFELFKRLNTGGAQTSPQEVRNCVLVATNVDFFRWLDGLSNDVDFKVCTALSDRLLKEQYAMELVCRFIAFRTSPADELSRIGDIGQFLDLKLEAFASDPHFPLERENEAFLKTFRVLREALGENVFRKYVPDTDSFKGPFLISMFEALGIGLGYSIDRHGTAPADLRQRIGRLVTNEEFINWTGSGRRASERVPHSIPLGREIIGA